MDSGIRVRLWKIVLFIIETLLATTERRNLEVKRFENYLIRLTLDVRKSAEKRGVTEQEEKNGIRDHLKVCTYVRGKVGSDHQKTRIRAWRIFNKKQHIRSGNGRSMDKSPS